MNPPLHRNDWKAVESAANELAFVGYRSGLREVGDVGVVNGDRNLDFFYQRSQTSAKNDPGFGGLGPLGLNEGDGFLNLIKQVEHNCILSTEGQRHNLPDTGFGAQVAIVGTRLKHGSKR